MLRAYVPAAVLGATALAIALAPAQRDLALRAPLTELPRQIGGLTGVDDTIPSEQLRKTQHPEYVMRTFGQHGQVGLTLYVAYYGSRWGRDGYHMPEDCLPGSGWKSLQQQVVQVSDGTTTWPVHRHLVGQDENRALVFYWFQGRGRVTASEWMTRYHLAVDAVWAQRSDEAFVRVVVPMPRATPGAMDEAPLSDAREADRLGREAIRQLLPEIARVLPAPRV